MIQSSQRGFSVILVLCALALNSAGQRARSDVAKEQYIIVLKSLSEKDYVKAIAVSKMIIERMPGHDRAYQRMIEASKKLDVLSQTEEYFHESDSSNPLADYGLGLIQQQMNEHKAAIADFQKCIVRSPEFLPAYRALVESYLSLKQEGEAESYLKSASGLHPDIPGVHYGMGYLYYRQRKYEIALAASERAIELSAELADARLLIAQIYNSTGRYQQSLAICQDMLARIDEQDVERFGTALVFIGAMRWKLANYDQATDDLNRALDYARSTSNKSLEMSALGHLGAIYWRQDSYVKALAIWQNCLRVARDFEDRLAEGRYLGNIGLAHRETGKIDQAITYFREALALAEQVLDLSNEITNCLNIGEVYVTQKKYKEAEHYFHRAIHRAQHAGSPALESYALLDVAHVHSETANHAEASLAIEKALQLARKTGALGIVGEALNASGNLRLRWESPSSGPPAQGAIDNFREALSIGETARMPKIIWQAHTGLAAAFEKIGQLAEADAHYRQAIDAMEDVRVKLEGDEERAGFLEDKVKAHHNRINLLLKLRDMVPEKDSDGRFDREAFATLERARARSFLDLLAGARASIEQDIDQEFRGRKDEISHRLSETQTRLLRELSSQSADRKKIQELERELANAKEELSDWRRLLRLRYPRIAELLNPVPINLQQTQQMLGENSVLLEYSLGENQAFLFAVTNRNYLVVRIPSGQSITDKVEALLKMLRHPSTENFDAFCQNASELYQDLIAPAAPLLSGKKEIIIAADGVLHYLPFGVLLRTPDKSSGDPVNELDSRHLPYLITDFAIAYVPSASVLAGLTDRRDKMRIAPEQFLAFADPNYGRSKLNRLLKSRYEVAQAARFFSPKRVKLFLGKEASEGNARNNILISQYRVVHFAVHGLFDDRYPQRSGLRLSVPQNPQARISGRISGLKPYSKSQSASHSIPNALQNDGVLDVNEIFGLKLNADLVALSACETGLGKIVKGEGLIGLTRAFLYAGTPSVIVSLWQIGDGETAPSMIQFYKNLTSGKHNKAEALRAAQLEAIHNGEHPGKWASFILVGQF